MHQRIVGTVWIALSMSACVVDWRIRARPDGGGDSASPADGDDIDEDAGDVDASAEEQPAHDGGERDCDGCAEFGPSLRVIFPWSGVTDAATIQFRVEARGAGDESMSVTVGGLTANAIGSHQYLSPPIDLSPGSNEVEVVATDSTGAVVTRLVRLDSNVVIDPTFVDRFGNVAIGRELFRLESDETLRPLASQSGEQRTPIDLTTSVARGADQLLSVVNGAVMSFDVARWEASVVSAEGMRGQGPALGALTQSIALGQHGLYVLSAGEAWELIRVDLDTGDRELLVPRTRSPRISGIAAVHEAGAAAGEDVLYVWVNSDRDQYLRMSGSTGAVLSVAYSSTPSGDPVVWTSIDALSPDSLHYAAAVTPSAAVIAINPLTNQVSTLSDAAHGSGPLLRSPRTVVATSTGLLVTDDGLDGLLHIDYMTGDRRFIAHTARGLGPSFSPACCGAYDEKAKTVWFSDFYAPYDVYRAELATGNRTMVDAHARAVCRGDQPDSVFAVTSMRGMLGVLSRITVDSATAISGGTLGAGLELPEIAACFYDAERSAVYVAGGGRVFAIDPKTGDRRVVSSTEVGFGPTLPSDDVSDSMAFDNDAGLLYATYSQGPLFAIDVDSGDRNRVEFSEDLFFRDPGLLWSSDSSRLLGYGFGLSSTGFWAADPATGEREFIAAPTVDGGPHSSFGPVFPLGLHDGDRTAIAADLNSILLIDLSTDERVILSK